MTPISNGTSGNRRVTGRMVADLLGWLLCFTTVAFSLSYIATEYVMGGHPLTTTFQSASGRLAAAAPILLILMAVFVWLLFFALPNLPFVKHVIDVSNGVRGGREGE